MKKKQTNTKKKAAVTKKKGKTSVSPKKKTTVKNTKSSSKKTITKKGSTPKKKPTAKTTEKKTVVASTKKKKVINQPKKIDKEKSNKKVQDDLIITREIDLRDLDSYIETENAEAEYLADTAILDVKQIQEALEKSEQEDVNNDNSLDTDEDYQFLIELDKHKKKKVSTSRWLILLFLIIIIFILVFTFVNAFGNKNGKKISVTNVVKNIKKEQEEEKKRLQEEEEKKRQYEECLAKPFDESDTSDEIINYVTELNSYLDSKSKISVLYKDLSKGYEYKYNESKSYYAASTIKSLDALYIYNKAAVGEINLDDTMTYTSAFSWSSSKYMKTHKYGDKISLRDLVKHAIMVSDNSAHQMLVSYIGRSKLQEYGYSLGAKLTLQGGDNFGRIDVNDAAVYMNTLYTFINSNEELGSELKSYFVESEQNDLKKEGIDAACKYGEYSEYYHNIGIVFDKNPYILIILTKGGKSSYLKYASELTDKVYNLHNLYYSNRENICKTNVYGN